MKKARRRLARDTRTPPHNQITQTRSREGSENQRHHETHSASAVRSSNGLDHGIQPRGSPSPVATPMLSAPSLLPCRSRGFGEICHCTPNRTAVPKRPAYSGGQGRVAAICSCRRVGWLIRIGPTRRLISPRAWDGLRVLVDLCITRRRSRRGRGPRRSSEQEHPGQERQGENGKSGPDHRGYLRRRYEAEPQLLTFQQAPPHRHCSDRQPGHTWP